MKIVRTILLVLISISFFSCNISKITKNSNPIVYTDSLTLALKNFQKHTLIPGFSTTIVNNKKVLYSKAFGYSNLKDSTLFTPMTINWIASISKTFVAFSIMKLVEEKKISLEDSINSILPYKIYNPYFPNSPIKIKHLLNHTSTIIDDAFVPYYIGEADICIVDDDKKYDSLPSYLQPNLKYYRMGKKISLDENIRKYTQRGDKWYIDSTFLRKEPGQFFQYSNLGASIAARIVEIKSNMSFKEFTKKNIFQPLKMENTGWDFEDLNRELVAKIYAHNEENHPTSVVEHPQYYMTNYPVSGLKTNSIDLSKFLIEMIKGYEGKGNLLNRKSYQTLFQSQSDIEGLNKSDTSIFNDKFNIATIWSVTANGIVLHFGGNTGVYSFIYFNPKTKKGALAFCNLRDSSFGELLTIINKYEELME
jgi:CubicO group peptidase (beta-lactamase class C family)